jgi:hypothetical protein
MLKKDKKQKIHLQLCTIPNNNNYNTKFYHYHTITKEILLCIAPPRTTMYQPLYITTTIKTTRKWWAWLNSFVCHTHDSKIQKLPSSQVITTTAMMCQKILPQQQN